MPAISKIRLTNVVYEDGGKRFNDEVFLFDGHNGAIILENGGGKTVFIHTVSQAILPHTHLGERKIRETLQLENAPAHIGIEWIINERPRRYLTTSVSLFLHNNQLNSHKYIYEYEHGNLDGLEHMPFVKETNGKKRPAYKEEIADYYSAMKQKTHNAQTFDTITSFHNYIEEHYQLIKNEWESVVKINRDEGGIEGFFENCKTTTDLYDRLLIPTVEDSIAGHTKDMFADMFEKQRTGFQTYRNLKNSMKEHREIQAELETYVTQFKQFSDQQDVYENSRRRAKGLAILLNEQQTSMNKELLENEVAWDNWNEEQINLDIKHASFHIAQQQAREKSLEVDYLTISAERIDIEKNIRKKEQLFHSLQYAQLHKQLRTYEQLFKQYEVELNKLSEKSEIEDYETELEIENEKLHGYFSSKLEQLEKAIETSELNMRPIQRSIVELTEKRTRNDDEHAHTNELLNHLKGQLTTKLEYLENMQQQLLANPQQEHVSTEFEKWTERFQFLDEEIIRLKQLKKTSEQNIVFLEQKREEKVTRLGKINLELNENKHIIKQKQHAHDTLIMKLTDIRETWKTIDNLYLKGSSVKETLHELLEKLKREREELLYKERLSRRFVDDYDAQETFFTDAFLAERLNDWKNQFYITTGPEFYASLSESEQATYSSYPLWPLTLITTEENRIELKEKLETIQEKLQYPITILSLEEVKHVGSEALNYSWIIPTHWKTNLDMKQFKRWQDNLRNVAEETTALRLEKEDDINKVRAIFTQFNQFFITYPPEFVESLNESIRSLQTEQEKMKRSIKQFDQQSDQLKREISTIDGNIEELSSERHGLENKINVATTYFKEEREVESLEKKRSETEQKIKTLQRERRDLAQLLTDYEAEKQTITDYINDNIIEIKIVHANDLYNEVKAFRPVYTDDAQEVINGRRETLKLKIHGIQQSYGEIVAKHTQSKKDIERLNEEINKLLQSFDAIDKELEFPVDGERLLNRTEDKVKEQKVELEIILKTESEARDFFIRQQERVTSSIDRFKEDYPGHKMVHFEQKLEDVAPTLENTKKKLTERKTFLHNETNRIKRDLTNIDEAIRQLENFQEAHHFNSTTVNEITLSEKERVSFSYERMTFVNDITATLRTEKDALIDAEEKIDRAKQQFHTFCRRNITERKLREMATEGIEIKRTYEEILEFQENMLTTVERADQYARDYISQKDKDVQAFINSIHNHLINVTEQLQVIPNNTKVKVGDKWRNIFHFTIPKWTEEDGKSRIRENIDWILEQLESHSFKDEHGLEDTGKVRKHIETWLDTRQLLQVVMNDNTMKVSCRKVTNDNKVSHRLTLWEQSNQWSGGEKWSKNMTLFLGILNFVAEKKQHIPASRNRHRAVILDNPFGKASSSHVLSPVFFIAEQLGFQIIALTAHADGKFLQDYFPINYSLKLRASADSSKQVMTTEKSLHHAYFQDHEPEAMKRLEEREQMELF